ncbi:MAG TPA: Fe-Mn family superoxide dismutase [bacterium]
MTYTTTKYTAKDYSALRGLHAITDAQVEEHLKLYNGYVNRTNSLFERLAGMVNEGQSADAAYQELKRRTGWEFNGMRLHEYYFDNLKPGGTGDLTDSTKFGDAIAKQFGSVEKWKEDLMGVAKAPGIGWAITYQDPDNGQLFNQWVTEHEQGHPAGCKPILVLDLFEHAFSVYLTPTQRGKYLEDFFANVDWDTISGRI